MKKNSNKKDFMKGTHWKKCRKKMKEWNSEKNWNKKDLREK